MSAIFDISVNASHLYSRFIQAFLLLEGYVYTSGKIGFFPAQIYIFLELTVIFTLKMNYLFPNHKILISQFLLKQKRSVHFDELNQNNVLLMKSET